MKKLIMLLTAVCVVGMVKGAAVNWQFSKDTTLNGWTVYAFDSASQATVLGALAAFDADALTTINGLVLSSAEVKKGVAKGAGTDVGDATSLMLLAINGAFAADQAFKYDTLDITAYTYTPPETASGSASLASFGNTGTIVAKGGGGGGGTDIPEPTSGLLLLVGGAMLALRRKRG